MAAYNPKLQNQVDRNAKELQISEMLNGNGTPWQLHQRFSHASSTSDDEKGMNGENLHAVVPSVGQAMKPTYEDPKACHISQHSEYT